MKKKGLIVVSIVIAVIAYEGVTAKLIYDLNTVLSNPIVQAEVARSRLPDGPHIYANLSPWPSLSTQPPWFLSLPSPSEQEPTIIFTKAMNAADYALKTFHDIPALQAIAVGVPVAIGLYCGLNIYKDHKRKKES